LTTASAAANSRQETRPEALRLEARALGRLILRRDVDSEFIERYVEAHNHLFTGPQSADELAIVRYGTAHPLVLPGLDAAAALTRPASLLHKKALLMAAILETSPRYADEFLPRRCGWVGLAVLTVRLGLGTLGRLLVGLPVLWFVRSRS
jgi:hypothetical protein